MAARHRKIAAPSTSLEQLLAANEVVVTCGVGKTTSAAALGAMAAAHLGGRVLVLTVDPAKRLANALGLEAFGNVECEVPRSAFTDAGIEPRGRLFAAMLDTKASWDDLVRLHAPDEATLDAILANPLYQNITGKFVQSHDYIAMERLYEIHSSGRYDLIVVDTPPTRDAIDFLEAPDRMAEFFGSRLLRGLTAAARSRVRNYASKPFDAIADRILGSQFLQDIGEFFLLFQTMYEGFVERSRAVSRLLEDHGTTFVVVSTLEPAPAQEAEFFVEALAERKLALGALVFNKVLPTDLFSPEAAKVAERLDRDAGPVAAAVADEVPDTEQATRVLEEVAASFLNYRLVASRESEEAARLGVAAEVVATVPYLADDVHDLAGLLAIGRHLW